MKEKTILFTSVPKYIVFCVKYIRLNYYSNQIVTNKC